MEGVRFSTGFTVIFLICSYERERLVSEISVSRIGILPHEHFIPLTADESGMNYSGGPDGIVLHCLLYFHIISIPFNSSDTGLGVAETINRRES